ncbi:MAG: hypothetical protein QXT73_01310 [Candidatus Methanomethylicaceae archaeon]
MPETASPYKELSDRISKSLKILSGIEAQIAARGVPKEHIPSYKAIALKALQENGRLNEDDVDPSIAWLWANDKLEGLALHSIQRETAAEQSAKRDEETRRLRMALAQLAADRARQSLIETTYRKLLSTPIDELAKDKVYRQAVTGLWSPMPNRVDSELLRSLVEKQIPTVSLADIYEQLFGEPLPLEQQQSSPALQELEDEFIKRYAPTGR